MASGAPDFAHLHVHSDYSILDGACKIPRLLDRVEEMGQEAAALTDHGVMSGAVQLYREAHKRGLTPVVGLEAYLVPDRAERPSRESRAHLTLLAETTEGYYNLIKLCSKGYLEGYHRKPRIDYELMEQHAEGIICLSGCLSGVTCNSLHQAVDGHITVDEGLSRARAELDRMTQIFGKDDVYVEIQHAGLSMQTPINEHLAKLARDAGLPTVATCDAHYPCREDAEPHDALLQIQTRDVLSNPNRFKFDTQEFYLKSAEEMLAALPEFGDAIARSVEIARRCGGLELPLNEFQLPRFPVPEGQPPSAYLERLSREGFARRYGANPPPEAEERLRFELNVIEEMGFSSYFLIVWDYIHWARQNGVAVGPGRGSAAGSLVSYTLRITDLDPLEHGLLFERFLNPARKSMPDIDTDFSVVGRDRVVQYVTEKYGSETVARIGTFGKLLARAVVRDAGRVLEIPYGQVDRIAKLVPERPIGITLEEAMKPGSELAEAYKTDEVTKRIVDTARPLEGLVRNEGVHAAGVVIAPGPITDYLPVRIDDDGDVVTQLPDFDVEALGLLKMDFLGLRNLDVIEGCVRLVQETRGETIDVDTMPLDDAGTYTMLARGDSLGVFQFESSGMREALREVGPTEFDDLIALVALYRPGPMAFISTYAKNKRDPSNVTFDDPRLEPITGPTYGVAVYQEQLMAMSRAIANFAPSEADDLRKAVSKKNKELMASIKEKFLDGCRASGTAEGVAAKLWGLCEAAGDYSFNKSHAACYALLAYRTAYLKANYPAEYMAALLSSVMDTKDRVPFYVNAAQDMGLEVLPPDVNVSRADFAVTGEQVIRFGLTAVKGVGDAAVAAIISQREEAGAYESLWDFCRRVDQAHVNKRALESLIKGGALDSTEATRNAMLEALPAAMGDAAKRRNDAAMGAMSLFEEAGEEAAGSVGVDPVLNGVELPRDELLAAEKEALGLYVSSHPLHDCRNQLARAVTCNLLSVSGRRDGEPVTVGGLIADTKRITTRSSGQEMMFARLEDLTGSVEIVVVPAVYEQEKEVLQKDAIVLISGRVDLKGEGETKVVAQSVRTLEVDPAAEEDRLLLDFGRQALRDVDLSNLKRLINDHGGDAPVVFVTVGHDGNPIRFRFGDEYRVDPRDPGLVAELKTLFGERVIA